MSTTTTGTVDRTETPTESIRLLDSRALASAAAVVAAVVMLLLGIFGAIGVYEGAVGMMEQWHLFFEPTVVGTIAGMIEAAIITFGLTYGVAWLYNAFAR
ncbi:MULTISPECIES: hypothetical protein [unclassified Haloferax]|jgi:hypothetical protein|uniref:hypothetical protein n=1 Tax=unclassified Haloferax TaxID=2625095 RepID=UPI002874E0D1|nr:MULTISPECIES: hypothetical protein [unclassified Haloferax]MDS0243199.1 hypothetical protein [Haloferax sp. S2CR25]MDS0446320.1 hypothetical protein [Haloferax sp. S2CR25-2]